ncbi:uncharacterized protein LOC101174385 [Oryzias latipes]|uniref:uncharacterized protein LOC101174385 n=1 Tax=Oryzias latipes TaxID=8090 RepID=UPI0000E9EDAF|nr:uncharacterized protein LOC101174385 [Oryzias latipes]
MGAGTSRGKKVAPASETEVKVTKTEAGISYAKTDRSPLPSRKILNVLRNKDQTQSCAQRRSEGHDLEDFSAEDDEELSTVLAEDDIREGIFDKKTSPKKSFIRSKTYGLCHFGQEDTGEDISSASQPRAAGRAAPRVSHSVSKDVNKDSTLHDNVLQKEGLFEVVSTSERQLALNSCHHSSQPMPAVLYDGSEEELMDTIEREFS